MKTFSAVKRTIAFDLFMGFAANKKNIKKGKHQAYLLKPFITSKQSLHCLCMCIWETLNHIHEYTSAWYDEYTTLSKHLSLNMQCMLREKRILYSWLAGCKCKCTDLNWLEICVSYEKCPKMFYTIAAIEIKLTQLKDDIEYIWG